MAAMLTRILGIPVNRKRVQRIFRKTDYIIPSKSKKEILRSKRPNVKADRSNQVWEADLTYIHCGIDGWNYLFDVFDIFTIEWVVYCFDLSAVKQNANIWTIFLLKNALVTHKDIIPQKHTCYQNRQRLIVYKQSFQKIFICTKIET